MMVDTDLKTLVLREMKEHYGRPLPADRTEQQHTIENAPDHHPTPPVSASASPPAVHIPPAEDDDEGFTVT